MKKLAHTEQSTIRNWFDNYKKFWKDLNDFANKKAKEWDCDPEDVWEEMFKVPKSRWGIYPCSLKKKLIRNGHNKPSS